MGGSIRSLLLQSFFLVSNLNNTLVFDNIPSFAYIFNYLEAVFQGYYSTTIEIWIEIESNRFYFVCIRLYLKYHFLCLQNLQIMKMKTGSKHILLASLF